MFRPVTLAATRRRRMGQQNPAIRFEVTDELGEKFLPGATMEVWSGGTLVLSKLADGGGNVSITPREMNAAAEAVGIDRDSVLTYSVSYPGYIPYQALLWDPEKSKEDQLDRIINVALVKESLFANPYVKAALTTGSFFLSSWFWSAGPGR